MIRNAAPEDAELIAAMIGELAEYERLSHEVVLSADDLREHLFGEHRYAETLIAEHDSAPVGFALFFHSYSTFDGRPGLYLEDLFVQPEARGLGYGKALLARLAQIAVERDCSRMEWRVLDWNEPSLRFYESLGAIPLPDWTTYRLRDAALKNLAAEG